MSGDYEWCLSRQAVERLIQFPPRRRRAMIDRLDRWVKAPHRIKGENLTTPGGRKLLIVPHQGQIFTLYIDDAVKRLEVLALE